MTPTDREKRIAQYAFEHLEEQINDSVRYEEPGLNPEEEQVYRDVCEVLGIAVSWPEDYIHWESIEEQRAPKQLFQLGEDVRATRNLTLCDVTVASGYVFQKERHDFIIVRKGLPGIVSKVEMTPDDFKYLVEFYDQATPKWVYQGWIEEL